MFQNVPECYGMFHVPGFIDAPVGRGYELDGWPTANIVLKVHTLLFLFFFFFFCVLCSVIVNSVLKSRFSIISPPAFRKRQKQRTNMAWCYVHLKIIFIRAVIPGCKESQHLLARKSFLLARKKLFSRAERKKY